MKPGIYTIGMQEYLSVPALSSGLCVCLDRYSPAHAKWEQDNPSEASTASDTGVAIHDAFLEGMDRIQPIDALDWRTKVAKEARDNARAAGLIPLLVGKVDQVKAAVSALRAFVATSELCGMLSGGMEAERTLVWQEDGITLKARPDALHHAMKLCVHLKSSDGSVAPGPFSRTVDGQGYGTSLAFYERACDALGLTGYQHLILAVEQNPPHGCALYGLDPSKAALEHAKVGRAIELWKSCMASGKFPSYTRRIHYLEAKPWELMQEEEQRHSQPFTEDEMRDGVPI